MLTLLKQSDRTGQILHTPYLYNKLLMYTTQDQIYDFGSTLSTDELSALISTLRQNLKLSSIDRSVDESNIYLSSLGLIFDYKNITEIITGIYTQKKKDIRRASMCPNFDFVDSELSSLSSEGSELNFDYKNITEIYTQKEKDIRRASMCPNFKSTPEIEPKSTPANLPVSMCPKIDPIIYVPQNKLLYDIDTSKTILDTDTVDDIVTTKLSKMQLKFIRIPKLTSSIHTLSELQQRKIKTILFFLVKAYNAAKDNVTRYYGDDKTVDYIRISKFIFDLLDKNTHQWIKDYLSTLGIHATGSYSSGYHISQKFTIDAKIFETLVPYTVDNKLRTKILKFETSRLRKKYKTKLTKREHLQLVGGQWLFSKLPTMHDIKTHSRSIVNPKKAEHLQNYSLLLNGGYGTPNQGKWGRVYDGLCTLPKWIRHKINGIAEVDIKASQFNNLLRIAYKDAFITYEEYVKYSGDVYTNLAPNLDRSSCKEQITKKYLSSTLSDMKSTEVYSTIAKTLPALNRYVEGFKGRVDQTKYTNLSRRLTQLESNIIWDVMYQLHTQAIPAYCLFDAILVPDEHKELTKKLLDESLKHYGVNTWSEF